MNRVYLLAIVLLGVPWRAPADEGPAELTVQEAERRLADYWVEVEATVGGKKMERTDLFCWSFVDDPDRKSPCCWLRCGEAVLSECGGIGVSKVLPDGTMRIKINGFPGIMKFERGSVIIATPKEGGLHCSFATYLRLTDEQARNLAPPKDFTSTKVNGQVVRVMMRTAGLYATEPVSDSSPRQPGKGDR